jgi:hypothetical protein
VSLAEDQVVDGVTTPSRTVIDCARLLPFDEALAIADSALRSGFVTREELTEADVRGAGALAVRRVVRHADPRAANPFESVLRALCLEAGLSVEPQGEVVLGHDVIHPAEAEAVRTGCVHRPALDLEGAAAPRRARGTKRTPTPRTSSRGCERSAGESRR